MIEYNRDPLQVFSINELPSDCFDEETLNAKKLRDLKKLQSLIEYTQTPGSRKQFLNEYFGVQG
ncbi:MAG: hypothetical protein R3C03_18020 [Pirellulaceae bacterium]